MEINKSVEYLRNVKCADVYTESQTDYVLPDYLGDVRKILYTEATLNPSGRFAGGDEVEFSGVVVYNVIYIDAEGELSSVSFSSDYDYSVKCSGENYSDSIANTRVSNFVVRLIGPRKINAKTSLVGSVRLSERSTAEVEGDGLNGDESPELDTGSVLVRTSITSAPIEREYAEAVAVLEGAIVDEVSVIYPFAEATVDDIVRGEDSVKLKGRLSMGAVIKNANEPAYTAEKQIAFEEEIEFEGISSTMTLIPQVSIISLKSSVNANDTGVEIVLSGIAELYVIGEENKSVELVLDGYLKEYPTTTTYSDFCYTTLLDSATVKGSHSAELNREDMESEWLREVLFLSSTPKIESVSLSEGVVTILGEIRYSGIASEIMDEKVSYSSIKFSSPFATNVNINCQNDENVSIEAEVHTSNTTASIDGERLYCSCAIESSVIAVADRCERVLSSISRNEGAEYEDEKASITVYYPTSEDTLFSVAKRFHTSRIKLASDNSITEQVFSSENPTGNLSGIKKLIIY